MDKRPTQAEVRYLSLGYNRFYNLFEEIMDESFWEQNAGVRFSRIKNLFAVYTELIKYEPLKLIIKNDSRPLSDLLGYSFVKFIRNILQHFPFFDEWDSVYVDKEIVTALESAGSIDKFLTREHPYDTKFRIWNSKKKEMTYVNINLNTGYVKGHAVFLSDILNEQDGVILLCIIMKKYLDTQVETRGIDIKEKKIIL